uniref:EB domain-containing protein n=1 Tax=Trichuris muris TaxID=70415 RepID=A0A5S6QAD4_TRIMR
MLTIAMLFFALHVLSRIQDQASSLGQPIFCKDHDDCSDQTLCANGTCEQAVPSYKGCVIQEDCQPDGRCMYGLCWLINDNLCPEGQTLYAGGYSRCKILPEESKKHSSCPNGYYCNELIGRCCSMSSMVSLGGNCSSSKCEDSNAYCISDICTCRPGFNDSNGVCIRQGKQLHQPCALDVECEVPYSRCENNSCECPTRFHEDIGNCKPDSYSCPFGQPISYSGKIVECQITKSLLSQRRESKRQPGHSTVKRMWPMTRQYYTDSCPTSAYCVTFGSPTMSELFGSPVATSGYCCPKLKYHCPVGDEFEIPKGIPCQLACPTDTHFCFTTLQEPSEQTCCPMPCPKDQLYTENRCVQQKAVGQPCSSDKECLSHNAKCIVRDKKMMCSCETDEVEYKGNCMVPSCPTGKPMTNKAGNYVRCTVHCPTRESFCHDQFQVCCPTSRQ